MHSFLSFFLSLSAATIEKATDMTFLTTIAHFTSPGQTFFSPLLFSFLGGGWLVLGQQFWA